MTTSGTSTALLTLLANMETKTENIEIPKIIQNIENTRPMNVIGTRSPYLNEKREFLASVLFSRTVLELNFSVNNAL